MHLYLFRQSDMSMVQEKTKRQDKGSTVCPTTDGGGSLPYLNDWRLIGLTVLINVTCALFVWNAEFGMWDLLIDTVFCVWITTFLDVFVVAYIIRRKRWKNTFSGRSSGSWLIRVLPSNKYGLSLMLGLLFTAFMLGLNGGLFRFYAFQSLSLLQFVVWKAVYSCVLSAWIINFAIFRLVQSACSRGGEPLSLSGEACPPEKVKEPIPRISWLSSFLRGMVLDFGTNVAAGLFLGGTVISGDKVILLPTQCKGMGMLIMAGITGVIIALFLIPVVSSSVLKGIRNEGTPPIEKTDAFFSHLPHNRLLLTVGFIPLFSLLTVLVCWGIFTLFDFDTLNFFQFYLIRIIYISLLCKALVPFCIRLYRQPDRT